MRWIRSWPAGPIPAGRAYVVDELPRLEISDYDYTPLGDLDEDVCLLEWDMAISLRDRLQFETRVAYHPQEIVVAPYQLYEARYEPEWAHRRALEAGTRFVRLYEPTCNYFGFGMIYLPRELVRAFLAAEAPARGREPWAPGYDDTRFHDQTFSAWYHWQHQGPPVAILWDLHPIHLHY